MLPLFFTGHASHMRDVQGNVNPIQSKNPSKGNSCVVQKFVSKRVRLLSTPSHKTSQILIMRLPFTFRSGCTFAESGRRVATSSVAARGTTTTTTGDYESASSHRQHHRYRSRSTTDRRRRRRKKPKNNKNYPVFGCFFHCYCCFT